MVVFSLLVVFSGAVLLTAETGPDNTGPAATDVNSEGGEVTVSGVGFCGCDLVWDGVINFYDFAVLAAHWQAKDCSVNNDWCDGADINQDYSVDHNDLRVMAVLCWLEEDTQAPTPDPMDWDYSVDGSGMDGTPHEVPRPCGSLTCYWAVMRADPNTADVTGFEFYFECHDNHAFDSNWISFPQGPPYKYEVEFGLSKLGSAWRVKARDNSVPPNETLPSDWTAPPWP
jgi:hypothetical protein